MFFDKYAYFCSIILKHISVMEITISTRQILKLLQLLSWIIFIGLCVQAGGIVFSAVYSFAINPANTRHFWENIDLSGFTGTTPGNLSLWFY